MGKPINNKVYILEQRLVEDPKWGMRKWETKIS